MCIYQWCCTFVALLFCWYMYVTCCWVDQPSNLQSVVYQHPSVSTCPVHQDVSPHTYNLQHACTIFISLIEKERLKGEQSFMVGCCAFTASMARVHLGCIQFNVTVTAVVMQPGERQGREGCRRGATGYFLVSLYACTKEKMLCCDYSKCPHA